MLPSTHLASGNSSRLFNRELSWVAFNRRLLYEAADASKPVLDRLLKLSQTAAALDEYFMTRVPLLKGLHEDHVEATGESHCFQRIHAYLRSLLMRQQAHFAFNLKSALAQQGIFLLNYSELTDSQKSQCHRRFEDEVVPVLTALISYPGTTTPDFSNLSIHLAVGLKIQQERQLGWIKLPRVLPRFWVVPNSAAVQQWVAVPLEQVIVAHLPKLFADYDFFGCFPLRVTRSINLGALDSESANLMEMIQEGLHQRQQQGKAVRLEMLKTMPAWLQSRLTQHLQLASEDVYSLNGWLGLSDLHELTRLPRPDLLEPDWHPVLPADLLPQSKPTVLSFSASPTATETNWFQEIRDRDLLLHFPYHSFTATVENFVDQAAADPAVLAIKMTLYRTAVDAPIVRSLIGAAKAGKQIVVLVELTAPLDEAINIHWAKSLEKAGAHVVYGVVGFRTHTNLILVIRRETNQIRRYAYIGTGDYLPDRPQPYEDLGLMTSRADIGTDLSHLFNFLTGCSREVAYSKLMVAPGQLKTQLLNLISQEAQHAQQGRSAHLLAKLNLLADPDVIEALYTASQAGVTIDLIVRGICRLRPGVPGMSDRIRVVSVLGQHVEHSRILYCQNGGTPQAWLGTADWTPGGLNDRIEVMVPLTTPQLVANVRQLLSCLLTDNQNSWVLQANGQYVKPQPTTSTPEFSAQQQFIRSAQLAGRKVQR